MSNPQITQILSLLLQLAGVALPIVLSGLAAAGARMLAREKRHSLLVSYVAVAVKAAEQSVPQKSLRYGYVAALVHTRFPELPEPEVSALIEGAVADLHMALGQFSAAIAPVVPAQPHDPITEIEQALALLRAQGSPDAAAASPAASVAEVPA